MVALQTLYSFLTNILTIGLGTQAEKHTVTFKNNCGRGTAKLIQGSKVLHSGGGSYTHHGPLMSAIAYLDTGPCKFNGEECTTLETTLRNPPSPGAGSSTDVTLIPPHKFNVAVGFSYSGGCNGVGNRCGSASCCPKGAFCKPDDYQSQRQCQTNNVSICCE
ncbi:glycopeptide protein [Rhizoctonia solani AG-3 Rhs1AP]|uniref:Glycopeptide protein n=1 Tax=Rhizoctonia solani AG-3 Rhs1AP TaxID=1086054 RepID=A0A0A1UKD0_9AGAM|nr:glycopeptide protein [Rhizoctonia solani AG-3 Rhs1AP]